MHKIFVEKENKMYLCTHKLKNKVKIMAQTIAILNGKGGVGKTTTAINLGTALWIMNKRVLLVDADPQCNLTVNIDRTAYNSGVNTLYEWMMDEDIDQIPVYERYPGLDYVPASNRMESLNSWLVDKVRREDYLINRLERISSNYDYIIIDCAPAVDSLLNLNVLVATDGIIVPTRTDFFGVQSQGAMMAKVAEVRKVFRKPLPILGYLLTQWEKTKADKEIRDYFKDDETVNLFRAPIRKCSACRSIQPRQMSLFEFDANTTAADDYMMLAEDILGIKVRPKSSTPRAWREKAFAAYQEFIGGQEE